MLSEPPVNSFHKQSFVLYLTQVIQLTGSVISCAHHVPTQPSKLVSSKLTLILVVALSPETYIFIVSNCAVVVGVRVVEWN